MRSGAVPKTVDEYLAGVPEPARTALKKIRATIRSIVPAETTESISYGIPMFKYKGMVMGYAAFANHCSLFPGAGPTEAFKEELKGFPTAKGTIRFTVDKPVPVTLLKKMVKLRIAENEATAKKKR